MEKPEKVVVDLSNEKLVFTTAYFENGQTMIQLVFENTVIVLTGEQWHRLVD